jgi:predicted RNase H-like HicB family nuclease
MSEIIFEVREDETDGGYTASALGSGIHTEADTLDELRRNVREAVDCFYDDPAQAPKIIRLVEVVVHD